MRVAGNIATLLGLALGLAGCGSVEQSLQHRPPWIFSVRRRRRAATPRPQEESAPDVECPGVSVRTGAATLMIGSKPGEEEPSALDLRYQATIVRTARECQVNSGIMTMKVGVEGRVITGPAGGPGTVDVPLRLAVVQEGVNPKTILSKFASVEVVVAGSVDRVPLYTSIRKSRSRCRSRYPTSTLMWSMWDSMLRGHSRKEERNLRPSRSREQRLGQIRAKTEEASQCDGLRAFTIAI